MNPFVKGGKPPSFESRVYFWKKAGDIAVIRWEGKGTWDNFHVGLEVGRNREDIMTGAIIRLLDGEVAKIEPVHDDARRQYKEAPDDPRDFSYVHIIRPVFEAVVPSPKEDPSSDPSAPPVGSLLIAANGVHVVITGYQDEVFPGGHRKVRAGVRRADGRGLYAVYLETVMGWRRAK